VPFHWRKCDPWLQRVFGILLFVLRKQQLRVFSLFLFFFFFWFFFSFFRVLA